MTTDTSLSPRGSEATEGEPTPTPHSAGSEAEGGRGGGSTGTRARVRARLQVPSAPELLHTLFVGDGTSPWPSTLPRCKNRIDYARHGTWCAPGSIGLRWAYLLLYTLPIACPIALAIDFIDWATHPAGRLIVTALIVWIAAVNL